MDANVRKNAKKMMPSSVTYQKFSTTIGIRVTDIVVVTICFQIFQGTPLAAIVRSDTVRNCENGIMHDSGNCTCYPGYTGDYCDVAITFATFSHQRPNGIRFQPTYLIEQSGAYGRISEDEHSLGSGSSGEEVEFSAFLEVVHGNSIPPGSERQSTDIHVVEQVYCINGFMNTIFVACDCRYGYTGEYCEAGILSNSGNEASGSETEDETDTNSFELSGSSTDSAQCINGVPIYHENCICHFGYTGKSCESQITVDENSNEESSGNDEGSGRDLSVEENIPSGYGEEGTTILEEDEVIGSGYPDIEENMHSGRDYEGEKPTINEWSATPMDELLWNIIPEQMHSVPSVNPLHEGLILQKTFAVVSIGINETDTELHTAYEPDEPDSVIYRFTFVPNLIGGKSRLELTTCFTRESDVIRQYKGIPKEADKLMKTSCPASHLPLSDMHTYDYEIFIAKNDMSMDGKYVITQWHGSADPSILRDQKRCIAKVSMKDIHNLCSKGFCSQGEVFDSHDRFMGINYNQGGYPPLTMTLHDGYFIITARSDERVFIEKGGCSKSGIKSVRCPDHSRQQFHVLWSLPAKKFKFDQWVKFRWDIKWSEYDSGGHYINPGRLISDALIRVWMDGQKIVDWKGPCGRNDADRIPYFKIGIYNPSGSQSPIRHFMRRYRHSHSPLSDSPDVSLKNAAKNLKKAPREYEAINRNVLKSVKKLRFGTLSSTSQKQCTLHAEKDYLAFLLSARFGKMVIDDYTKKIISHLIYELENQELRIKSLETRLDSYKGSKAKRSSAYDEL